MVNALVVRSTTELAKAQALRAAQKASSQREAQIIQLSSVLGHGSDSHTPCPNDHALQLAQYLHMVGASTPCSLSLTLIFQSAAD